MADIDYAALRPTLDPEGAYERNRDMPQQSREAWQAVLSFKLPESYRDIDSVIVAPPCRAHRRRLHPWDEQ